MIKKITALSATAVLAAGALMGVSAPVQAATKTIYTQCTDGNSSKKLTKKTLSTTSLIACTDLANLSALKGAKKMDTLVLQGSKKLKITGTSQLRGLGVQSLLVNSPVTDPTFAFAQDFPKLYLLHTGPTKVSSVANIAKLKELSSLSLWTNKSLSLKKMVGNKELFELNLHVGSAKADFTSLAKLPQLSDLAVVGSTQQSPAPLKTSKSLTRVEIIQTFEKKLSKGQSYKAPSALTKKFGVPRAGYSIGWTSKEQATGPVKSNGTGFTYLVGSKNAKLGRLNLTNTVSIFVSTPGKMNFYTPVVSSKSARKGQSIKAVVTDRNDATAWGHVIAKCSYQWQRGTKNIKGATKLAYKATSADVGKTLRLKTSCSPHDYAKIDYGFKANTKYTGAVKIHK